MPNHNTSMRLESGATGESSFTPQLDNEASLWDVSEITQETATQYRIKWLGADPQTGKPWAQVWVPKSDCTDDLILKWKAKLKPQADKKNGSLAAEGKSLPRPKRKPESHPEEDAAEPTKELDKVPVKTVKTKPSKRRKQEVDDDDTPFNTTQFDSHNSLKVGPPRGVCKRHPTSFQAVSHGPSPALKPKGEARGGEIATYEAKDLEAVANPPSKKNFGPDPPGTWAGRQLLSLPESSDAESTLPQADGANTTVSASGPSNASTNSESNREAFREHRVRLTSIAANILTLHGLVKRVDMKLETAMRELRELETSLQ